MNAIRKVAAGMVLGTAVFFAFAAMLTLSSGAAIFKYQGF
jgi:hypothetical protein